jgi:hypothetical protein
LLKLCTQLFKPADLAFTAAAILAFVAAAALAFAAVAFDAMSLDLATAAFALADAAALALVVALELISQQMPLSRQGEWRRGCRVSQ